VGQEGECRHLVKDRVRVRVRVRVRIRIRVRVRVRVRGERRDQLPVIRRQSAAATTTAVLTLALRRWVVLL